ncbi:MAG: hypothetical protein LBR33_02315 [Propionibacteriaceae bacterium]|nr:hypothetical protein [Propionibacteriaceae bacterium]
MKRLGLLLIAVALIAAAVGRTGAYWSHQAPDTLGAIQVTTHPVTITVSGLGDDKTPDQDHHIDVTFGADQAAALLQSASDAFAESAELKNDGGRVTWTQPFTLTATADGTIGVGYSVTRIDPAAPVYARGLELRAVDSVEECEGLAAITPLSEPAPDVSPTALPEAQPSAIPALPYKTAAASFQQVYCLVVTVTPRKYENVATASVDLFGKPPATQQASWYAWVFPNPATEPDTVFRFSFQASGAD